MIAVFKREFKAYFTTPIGYIVLAAAFMFLGIFFTMIYSSGLPAVPTVIVAMATIVLFMIPILTMRLMSEDRRQKVDQALLTAPVSLTAIVMGKFLAAMAVYAICFIPTIAFEIIVASFVTVNILYYIYALIGVLLLGAALISIGMFVSSLTESSAVAAMVAIVVNFMILFMGSLAGIVETVETPDLPEMFSWFEPVIDKVLDVVGVILEKASLITVFESFEQNMFSIADIIYFLSITVAFIFLSVRSLEKRRWA